MHFRAKNTLKSNHYNTFKHWMNIQIFRKWISLKQMIRIKKKKKKSNSIEDTDVVNASYVVPTNNPTIPNVQLRGRTLK
jgi:hypothetical protein